MATPLILGSPAQAQEALRDIGLLACREAILARAKPGIDAAALAPFIVVPTPEGPATMQARRQQLVDAVVHYLESLCADAAPSLSCDGAGGLFLEK